jgi:hypothetical protein
VAGEIRPEQRDDVEVADLSDDGVSNLAGALAATVRQSASQMPQDTPMALVYRLEPPDETAPR